MPSGAILRRELDCTSANLLVDSLRTPCPAKRAGPCKCAEDNPLPSTCDGHTLFLVGQSCIWRAAPCLVCVTTRYIADRQLVLVLRILKARARAAGAGVSGRDERVAVGVEKLTRAVESHLVAVNLDVPHEPLHASLEREPGNSWRSVKENEDLPNGFVGIGLRVAPDAKAWCHLAGQERCGVHYFGERAAASVRIQSRKGRDREGSARLTVYWSDLHPPRPLQRALTIRPGGCIPPKRLNERTR